MIDLTRVSDDGAETLTHTLRGPLSPAEYLRIGHALEWNARVASAPDVYIVLSRRAPLYRVQGAYVSVTEARTALALRDARLEGSQLAGWTADEINERIVVHVPGMPAVPRPGTGASPRPGDDDTDRRDRWCFIIHSYETDCRGFPPRGSVAPGDRSPLSADVGSISVTARFAGGRSLEYAVPRDADALFLSRGAVHAFVYPHYAAVFGKTYADTAVRRALAP